MRLTSITYEGARIQNKGVMCVQDERIVELFILRDESALTYTAQKYQKYLTKIAINILSDKSDADECVNDTYLAAWNSIPPNEPSVLSSYLAKLIRRIAIDKYRMRIRSKRIPSEYTVSLDELNDIVCESETPESEVELALLSQAINTFLKSVSKDARNLFIGRYYYHDSLKDVSKYCGVSESKAKSILYRTRLSLKEYLEKEGFEI